MTGSSPRNPCFVHDLQKLRVLLNLPVPSHPLQPNTFAEDACKGGNGRQGVYKHEMGNQGSLFLFPAHSFSHFVTQKNNSSAFQYKPGHNQSDPLHASMVKGGCCLFHKSSAFLLKNQMLPRLNGYLALQKKRR